MLSAPKQRRVALLSATLLAGCSAEFEPDEGLGEDDGTAESGGVDAIAETGDRGDGDGDGDGDSSEPAGDGDGDGDEPEPEPAGDGDGDGDEPDAKPSDLPDNAYCDAVADWDQERKMRALAVLASVNEARASGVECGARGEFPPTGPLVWDPALTCAARVHSYEMATYNFFGHTNLQGKGTDWRLKQAGYSGETWAENIAASYPQSKVVFTNWITSADHCAKLLDPSFVAIGIGYAFDPSSTFAHYWTLNLGG